MDDVSAEAAWRDAVRVALTRGDRDELGRLFSGAQELWGNAVASRLWLEMVSAFDANATTG
ncbi:MAG: hypothetical protein RLZZ163_547 [Actinomycetota bacterium]|jgi:hypothetical protein